MKKYISILIVAVMIFSTLALTACGGGGDVDEAQLRVDLLSDSDSVEEVKSAYKQLVKAQQKLIAAEEMLILEKEIL